MAVSEIYPINPASDGLAIKRLGGPKFTHKTGYTELAAIVAVGETTAVAADVSVAVTAIVGVAIGGGVAVFVGVIAAVAVVAVVAGSGVGVCGFCTFVCGAYPSVSVITVEVAGVCANNAAELPLKTYIPALSAAVGSDSGEVSLLFGAA